MILKIIGIILLSLLGLILFLVALIMFYPVSYNIRAVYEDSLCARVKVHWLFHLISVTLDYKEAGKKCILRILGIPILDFLNPKPKKSRSKKSKQKSPKAKKKPSVQNEKKTEQSGKGLEIERSSKAETFKKNEASVENKMDSKNENFSERTSSSEQEKERSKSKLQFFWKKITGFLKKLKAFIDTMIQKVTNLYHKGINIKEKIKKWVEILKRERTLLAVRKLKRRIMGLLKHILPRKWNAYVEYGFEDPGTTGQIYGYYWMFLGIWNEHFICVPNFEHKTFKGSIRAKGHLQVINFLYTAFQFMFDKDLVYLRKINTEVNS